LNGKKRDLLIQEGRIEKIGTKLNNKKAKVIAHKDLHVSIGWFDIGVHTGEPGLEHREDIQSITNAAAAGGYTGLACFPNTTPTIQTKAEILFFKEPYPIIVKEKILRKCTIWQKLEVLLFQTASILYNLVV